MVIGLTLSQRLAGWLDDVRKGPARLRRVGGRLGVVEQRLDRLQMAVARLEQTASALPTAAEQAMLAEGLAEFRRETRAVLAGLAVPPDSLWRGRPDTPRGPSSDALLPSSALCRQADFEQPWFADWAAQMGETLRYHRKLWEFVFIAQALAERGLLAEGRRGLGFGVGREPLTALFAARGCRILATDLAGEAAAEAGWVEGAQHAAGKASLRRPEICPDEAFEAQVDFAICDMNAIPPSLTGFDFCWSACALEHLGSIQHGLEFIARSVDTLRPGGWAVHTTEFNLGSDTETVDNAATVLFRHRDLEALSHRLAQAGHRMAPLMLTPGDGPIDRFVDTPPYRPEPHLTLALSGWPTTSVGVIVQRGDG